MKYKWLVIALIPVATLTLIVAGLLVGQDYATLSNNTTEDAIPEKKATSKKAKSILDSSPEPKQSKPFVITEKLVKIDDKVLRKELLDYAKETLDVMIMGGQFATLGRWCTDADRHETYLIAPYRYEILSEPVVWEDRGKLTARIESIDKGGQPIVKERVLLFKNQPDRARRNWCLYSLE